MSTLAAIKKQIAALEAQAQRIAKAEMSSAIAKVKGIMADFNLTIEHLTQAGTARRATKKTATKLKAKKASVAKYADPKTGKTWSGFGRAPGWIAGAKDRTAFLVNKGAAALTEAKVGPAAKKRTAKAPKVVKAAKKSAKPAAKKVSAAVKKASKVASSPVVAKKKSTVKKTASKKLVSKSAATKRAAPASVDMSATPAA